MPLSTLRIGRPRQSEVELADLQGEWKRGQRMIPGKIGSTMVSLKSQMWTLTTNWKNLHVFISSFRDARQHL